MLIHTFDLLFFFEIGSFLKASPFLSLFLFELIFLGELTELCHFLLEIPIFRLNFLFLLLEAHLFLSELIFFRLECLMNLIHFPSFFQQLGSRRYSFVLIENWNFRLLLHMIIYINETAAIINGESSTPHTKLYILGFGRVRLLG